MEKPLEKRFTTDEEWKRIAEKKRIKIRKYSLADYPSVREILQASKLFYEPNDSESNLRRVIGDDPDSILVAVENRRVVGTAFTESGFIPFIFRVAVHPEYRNRGIGEKLMQSAEEVLKNKGHSEANILVAIDESENQLRYERQGYEKGHTYVWMEKKL